MVVYQVCSNSDPRVQIGPVYVEKYKKNLLENHLDQTLEIWYIALPSGPIPSLFKWQPQGPKWPCWEMGGMISEVKCT